MRLRTHQPSSAYILFWEGAWYYRRRGTPQESAVRFQASFLRFAVSIWICSCICIGCGNSGKTFLSSSFYINMLVSCRILTEHKRKDRPWKASTCGFRIRACSEVSKSVFWFFQCCGAAYNGEDWLLLMNRSSLRAWFGLWIGCGDPLALWPRNLSTGLQLLIKKFDGGRTPIYLK